MRMLKFALNLCVPPTKLKLRWLIIRIFAKEKDYAKLIPHYDW